MLRKSKTPYITLNGGNIVGNTSNTFTSEDSASGGGVHTNGTFVMNGGNIVGNTCFLGPGGGVSMSDGTFVMNGGRISNNRTGKNGGGLYGSAGTFTLNGGEISENLSNKQDGGGVYVEVDHTFNMNGGKISNNNSTLNGGGVYTKGTFTMSGGEISGNDTTRNRGGGVYGNGTVLLGGAAKVINNTLGNGKTTNNYFVCDGKFITIGTKTASDDGNGVAAPTSEFKVGISMNKVGKFTSNGTEDDVKCFTSDIENYQVIYNADGYLELGVAPIPSPVMSPTGGYATSVTLTAEKGTIYYTTNGTNPTASSTRYMGEPIRVTSDNFVIKAIAIDAVTGGRSEIVTGTFSNVKKYTVNINAVNGTVDVEEIKDIVDGTKFSLNSNSVKIGDKVVTATANEGYKFNRWKINDAESVVTDGYIASDTKFTAIFEEIKTTYKVTINATNGTVSRQELTDVAAGTAFSVNGNKLTVGNAEITATANEGYEFDCWKIGDTKVTSQGTITANTTFTAVFKVIGTPVDSKGISTGAIVGICIAVLFVIIAIAYVLGYFFLYKKGKLDNKKIKVIYKFLPKNKTNK